jgi:hypothetical protein
MARTVAQIEALLLPFADGSSGLGDWTYVAEGIVGGVTTPARAIWWAAPLGTLVLTIEAWPAVGLARVISDELGINYEFSIDSIPGIIVKKFAAAGAVLAYETGMGNDIAECRTDDPGAPAPGRQWLRTDL